MRCYVLKRYGKPNRSCIAIVLKSNGSKPHCNECSLRGAADVMNFFSKITAISMTLKGIITLVVLAAIGVGGYYAYTGIMGFAGKIKEVGEDTGEFLAGRPTQHGAALGEKCNVGADCKGFVSAFNKQGGVACC